MSRVYALRYGIVINSSCHLILVRDSRLKKSTVSALTIDESSARYINY